MKRLITVAICLFLVVSIDAARSYGQQDDSTAAAKQIDEVLTFYQHLNKFNGNALVAKEGKIILKKSYGLKDAESNLPLDEKTAFRIYSITKSFTSALIFKLVESGKLSLSDKLSKFYPEIPSSEDITIEHLLSHTSGLYTYTREEHFDNSESNLVELLKTKPLDFPVGSGWNYCNSGYCLLGHIAAKVTGQTYEDAVRQHILEPLSMKESGFDFEVSNIPNKAIGYETLSSTMKKVAPALPSSGPFSAGEIYSTVDDLYLFYQGLQTRKIISDTSWAKATSPCAKDEGYGCGWQLRTRPSGQKVIFHGGGANGFRSILSQIPEQGLCVILLSNIEATNCDSLTDSIYKILEGGKIELPNEVQLSQSQLEKFVGFFDVSAEQNMLVRSCIVDGRLALDLAGQRTDVLIAVNEDTFSQPESGGLLKFVKDEQGNYQELEIILPNRKMHGVRNKGVWGIVGSATPGGWDGANDIPLERSADSHTIWTAHNVQLAKGELKFRFNNDWKYNFGDNASDGDLDRYGANIAVEAGVYDITLNFEDALSPTYVLTPQK